MSSIGQIAPPFTPPPTPPQPAAANLAPAVTLGLSPAPSVDAVEPSGPAPAASSSAAATDLPPAAPQAQRPSLKGRLRQWLQTLEIRAAAKLLRRR
jgi:hypothetical protein